MTSHYINKEFVLQHLCLDVPFPEVSHTTKNISEFLTSVLHKWELGQKVVAVLQDNARNILVLKEGFLSNKIINNLVYSCRKLVGHFKYSARVTEVLKTCQITSGTYPRGTPIRWNTTLHVLKRLYEQKRSILLASAELNIPEMANCQWTLIENIIPILDVLDSVTNHISSDHVTTAEVISLINVIEIELEKPAPACSGLQGLKNNLYNYENSDIQTSAILLDPRFKETPFKDKAKANAAKHRLLEEASTLQSPEHLFAHSKINSDKDDHRSIAETLKQYFSEEMMTPDCSVTEYWRRRDHCKPLQTLSKKYLCVPPVPVFSEILFSTAGFICDSKRNRLDPHRVKMLI
ncbi:hypothetical protein PR048_021658 [Dryococelus australis]|uniref:HAT C-terminal dimerisation domain-containing protein n=1 Tax=Dryococelus australis TaxID=614101 RepID=A0ABQ9GYU5_9NEOP|nr:hypothetical protein PR048_021658 [Dryococelus australis]